MILILDLDLTVLKMHLRNKHEISRSIMDRHADRQTDRQTHTHTHTDRRDRTHYHAAFAGGNYVAGVEWWPVLQCG